MSSTTSNKSKKPPTSQINFRHTDSVITEVEKAAKLANVLNPSDFHRTVYNAGLKALLGLNIVGNEIVDDVSKVG